MAESKYQTEYPEKEYLWENHKNFATWAIHKGQAPDSVYGSVNVPIYLSTTYAQTAPGKAFGEFDYTRCGNPTRQAFEDAIAACEHAKYGMAFSSGCAATTCVLHTLKTGDHVVCCDDVYGGTNRYLRKFAQDKHGIQVDFVDLTNLDTLKKAIKPNTKLVWIETPSNPTYKVCDVRELVKVVRATNQKIVIVGDNTFATPYLQSYIDMGVDISYNSVSKYIGGHSDVIMGTLTLNDKALYDDLFMASKSFGGCPSVFDCYLALRGLKTLATRVKQSTKNAYAVARYLQTHPKIESVLYPGLKEHKYHENVRKNMRGAGGMMGFYVKGGEQQATKFLQNLKVITFAESLGGVESLAEQPALMTHGSVPAEQRKALGITDNYVRLSVGIEDIEDILEDIDRALQGV